ncbi:hypothetical protein QBC44DRAFT_400540 [Cladorrhinum sp. PSN332]|nr:hypothetical protein QBC44DRAFT_400540 [Cladorrhinum sp. PSN332]
MSPYERTNLSFGVEIEFMFYYLVTKPDDESRGSGGESKSGESQASQDSHSSDHSMDSNPDFVELNEKEIRENIPKPMVSLWCDHKLLHPFYGVEPWACGRVKEVLKSVPGMVILPKNDDDKTPEPWRDPKNRSLFFDQGVYIDEGQGWLVTVDSSLEDSKIAVPSHPGSYDWKWVGIEVVSPAMYDTERAYTHIREVIDALTKPKQFLLRINMMTGFHVHVGQGKKRHHKSVLNRAAALAWAADGIMSYAHPPERGFNRYSPSIREGSLLAEELLKKTPSIGYNPIRIPQEYSAKAQSNCLPTPLKREFDSTAYSRFPSLRLKELTPGALARYMESGLDDGISKSDLAVLKQNREQSHLIRGVGYLMAGEKYQDTAHLLKCSWAPNQNLRKNYNFRYYQSANSYLPENERTRGVEFPDEGGASPENTTVEFREAAGSLNASWIITWASVCVGFFRTAKYATDEHFWALIHKLNRGEQNPGAYDMIDFLMDMGMPGPTRFLEMSLRGSRRGPNAFDRGTPRATDFWYPCKPVYYYNPEREKKKR